MSAYIWLPRNAMSATPDTRPNWLTSDGKPVANTLSCPSRSMREMRDVGPLLYGPTGGTTCAHCSVLVTVVPPVPASATYMSPLGAQANPLGNSRPSANTSGVRGSATGTGLA